MKTSGLFYILFIFTLIHSGLSYADTNEIQVDGRTVTIIEDNPYLKENTVIRENRGPNNDEMGRHTVKRYGTGFVSYYTSLLTTELAYCNNFYLPVIANNDETSTCRDEISAMLLDPGMFMGVLAMNATAIEIYKRARRPLAKFLITTSRRFGGRGRAAQVLSDTMISHLSMGAGIVMQTSVAASWNEPQMRKCTKAIWGGIKYVMNLNDIDNVTELYEREDGPELVSGVFDEAHEDTEGPCPAAFEQFKNTEDGTASEIRIAVLTMGATIAISTTAMSVIKFAGMALFKTTPAGFAWSNGIMITHFLLENVETWLERVVRAWDNDRRSKKFLASSFLDLNEAIDSVENAENNHSKYIGHYKTRECANFVPFLGPDAPENPEESGCHEWVDVDNYGFGIKETLKDYKYNVEYRKRGASNRFIETQTRWKEKASDIYTAVSAFQKSIKLIFELRDTNKGFVEKNSEIYYNTFSLLTRVDEPLNLPDTSIPNLKDGSPLFTTDQMNTIYNDVIRPLMEKCRESSYANRNARLQRVLVALHNAFHNNYNEQEIRMNLWRLKSLFSSNYISRYHSLSVALTDNYTGHRFTTEEVEKVNKAITNMVTSLTPQTALAHIKFEAEGIQFLENIEDEENSESSSDDTSNAQARRGIIQTQSPEGGSILKMNKDDDIPFTSLDSSWRDKVSNQGISSNKISAKILSHLVCGEAPNGIEFFWRDGRSDKVIFPNALKDPSIVKCDYRSEIDGPYSDLFIPDEDFLYIPDKNKLTRYFTDEALHRIYSYKGKETIGLLNVIIDPSVRLKWANYEEFENDWFDNMQPKLLKYALKLRKEYYESVDSYLDLFYNSNGCGSSKSETRQCANFNGQNLRNSISSDELNRRTQYRGLNKSYYKNVYTGDAIVEEFRTYALLAAKIFGENHEKVLELHALIPRIYDTIHRLDTEKQEFQFSVDDLSPEEVLERIDTSTFEEVLGRDNLVEYYDNGYNPIKTVLRESLEELKSGAEYEEISEADLGSLTNEQAELYILYKIYKNLDDSLNGLDSVILREYIGGASVTYMEQSK